MATFATAMNIAHMNAKQLRHIARAVSVSPVTLNNTLTSKATLITAIKAK